MKTSARSALILIAAALCLAAQTAAQELSISTCVDSIHALGLEGREEVLESKTEAEVTLEVTGESSRASVAVKADYDAAVPSRTGIELAEAWFEWDTEAAALTVGRQIIAWGKADGIAVTDIICPKNLTSFSGLEYTDSRLPVDAVRLRLGLSSWSLEALWIPVFTPSLIPIDADNPLTQIARPAEVPFLGSLYPVSYTLSGTPRQIGDGEYAVRVSYAGALLDASVCAFYGWDDLPWMTKSSVGSEVSVEADWNRILMAGADTAIPVGAVVFRLEGALIHGRYFEAEGLRADEKKNQITALAGFDWTPGSWTMSAQYLEDLVFDGAEGLSRSAREPAATLSLSRSLLRDTLKLSVSGYLGLNDFDGYGNLAVSYSADDLLSFEIGADLFSGGPDDKGDYESYESLNSLYLKASYHF